MPKDELKEIKQDLKKLEHNAEEKLRRSNRRDNLIDGITGGIMVLLLVGGIIAGAWFAVFISFNTLIWLGLCHIKDLHINHQRYIIDMLIGIKEIEDKHVTAKITEKEKANAKTNAASNRKG